MLILKYDIFNTSADKTTTVSGLRTAGSFPLQQRGGKLLQYLQTEPNKRTHHFTLIKTLSGDLECARHSPAIHYLIHGGDRNESFLSKQLFPFFFPSHQSQSISRRRSPIPFSTAAFMENWGYNNGRIKDGRRIKHSTLRRHLSRRPHRGDTMRWNAGRRGAPLPQVVG